MKPLAWIGLVLLVLGIASLLVAIPSKEQGGIKVGDVSIGVETHHSDKAPPIVSAAMILGGVGLLVAGIRKR